VEGIAKPQLIGDLFDQRSRGLQPFGGPIHFQPQQQAIGRLVVIPLEEPAEISGIDVAFAGDFGERFQAQVIRLDVLASPKGRSDSAILSPRYSTSLRQMSEVNRVPLRPLRIRSSKIS
jgi:hypothetical protein